MHVCGAYLHYLTTEAWPDVQKRMAQVNKFKNRTSGTASLPCTDASDPSQPSDVNRPAAGLRTESAKDPTVDEQAISRSSVEGQKTKWNVEKWFSDFLQLSVCVKRNLDILYLKIEYHSKHLWSSPYRIVVALIATNLPLALYTSILHQRGTLDVMKYISDQSAVTINGQSMSVMYLMPCHSTPYYG